MTQPWLSLTGLYEYDSTVLDNLTLPTAADYADIATLVVENPFVPNKTALVNYMLMHLAELPLLYHEPTLFKNMVGYWSAVQQPVWREMYRTLLYKYNPIWNKDGTITETRNITYSESGELTRGTTDTGTVRRQGESSGATENQVTGFDTNSYSPNKRDASSGEADETETRNLAGSLSDETGKEGESEDVFTRTEQGNIGVTTTQAMLQEQRKLAEFNFYEYVCEAFKKEFCICIY